MIHYDEVQQFGKVLSFVNRTSEVVCGKKNNCWEENKGRFVIIAIDNIFVPWEVIEWRNKGSYTLLFKLKYIDNPATAQKILNNDIFMFKRDIVVTSPTINGNLLWQHFVNFKLVDKNQGSLGYIERIDDTTANIFAKTDRDIIVPLHRDFIVSIDETKSEIAVCYPFDVQTIV